MGLYLNGIMTVRKSQKTKNKKQKTSQKKNDSISFFSFLIPKQNKAWMVVSFVATLFFIMASFGKAGAIGFAAHNLLQTIFGQGFFVVPVVLFYFAYSIYLKNFVELKEKLALLGSVISVTGLIEVFARNMELVHGGAIGSLISRVLVQGFDVYFSVILLFALLVFCSFVLFDPDFSSIIGFKEKFKKERILAEQKKVREEKFEQKVETALEKGGLGTKPVQTEKASIIDAIVPKVKPEIKTKKEKKEKEEDIINPETQKIFAGDYKNPPLKLLGKSSGTPSTGDIKANANLIQRTLSNFGIAVEMDEISVGPTVTRYAIKPAQGVRLNRIASLQNELALALAAKSIRIEAPIPGRSLVGIEVPNSVKSSIGLGSQLADSEFQKSSKPLLVSLGKGVSGKSHYANLAKMPHALIAGATGSGKSVTIHNIILSLLYKNGPDMLRFIMVDPKRVEMTLYKKIPHLLTPVITDPKKAVLALKWAVKEMERRYDLLQKKAVRDIDSYHKTIVAPAYKGLSKEEIESSDDLPEKMPYIVVIIDELSDIMSSYPRELEAAIVRLAQMSRAVGIHLLLATQRPSVNVITGLIKANVPSRLALKVASQVDSRTILDSRGAEKLLGQGDMLYKGEGQNEPVRIQCPYVSEEEIKSVISYIKDNFKFELEDEISFGNETLNEGPGGVEVSDDEDEDPMIEEARAVVVSSQKASTSYLQRRLSIGYSRAARIIDLLEDRGIIGPANGSKPREVFEKPVESVDAPEEVINE